MSEVLQNVEQFNILMHDNSLHVIRMCLFKQQNMNEKKKQIHLLIIIQIVFSEYCVLSVLNYVI